MPKKHSPTNLTAATFLRLTVGGNIEKMKTKLTFYILTLMFISIQLFSQSKKNDTEFYIQLGTNNGFRFNDPLNPSYDFQLRPIVFLGLGIDEISTQIGFSQHNYSHKLPIICQGPCPRNVDFKTVEFIIDLKYHFLDREKYDLESVLSFNTEFVYYQLNKRGSKEWLSENTPYKSYPFNIHLGFNMEYSIFKRFSLFLTPIMNISYLRPTRKLIITKDDFKFRTGMKIKLNK